MTCCLLYYSKQDGLLGEEAFLHYHPLELAGRHTSMLAFGTSRDEYYFLLNPGTDMGYQPP